MEDVVFTKMQWLTGLITAGTRLFRVGCVAIALGLMLATADICPAGHTDCDMGDMASSVENTEVCILACGVLLPVDLVLGPEFIGLISSLALPDPSIGKGFHPEPGFPTATRPCKRHLMLNQTQQKDTR